MTDLLRPRRLKPGDTIGVVAPASDLKDESILQGIQKLESLGFTVKQGKHLWDRHGYLAGTDEDRVADLHDCIADEGVHGIIAARGGFGCARLLPLIDWELIRRSPKIIQGYSDITVLLLAIAKECGFETYHGPMVVGGFPESPALPVESFLACQVEDRQQRFNAETHGFRFITGGEATGPLYGGCLTLLMNLCGTRYLPSFAGAILFLEDIAEEPYRLDRSLTQLKMATDVGQVAGVITGRLHNCDPEEPHRSFTFEDVLLDHFGPAGVPIATDFPAGHGIPQVTLPLGRTTTIDAAAGTVIL